MQHFYVMELLLKFHAEGEVFGIDRERAVIAVLSFTFCGGDD